MPEPRDVDEFTHGLWPDPRRGPWYVRANWVVLDGRPECVGLILWHGARQDDSDILRYQPVGKAGLQPITATALHSLPLGTILAKLREKAVALAQHNRRVLRTGWMRQHPQLADLPTLDELIGSVHEQAPKVGRKPKYGTVHFAEVAEVYLAAWQAGRQRPTRAVGDHFGVPRSTAAKWVVRARQEQLLSPGDHGRAGASPGPALIAIRERAAKHSRTGARS